MITQILECYHCGSAALVRNGRTSNGKQRFNGRDCGRHSRENPQPQGYTQAQQDLILRAYEERRSLRGLTRTFGVSRATTIAWIKKKRQLSQP